MSAWLPLVPLLPVLLPLLAAALCWGQRNPLDLRQRSTVAALLLVVAAAAVLASDRLGLPRSPAAAWLLLAGDSGLIVDWSERAPAFAAALLLLAALASATFAAAAERGVRSGGTSLAGLVLVSAGSALAVGAATPLVAVWGVGLAGLGGVIADLSSVPSDATATVEGLVPWLAGSAALFAATIVDPNLATTAPLWMLGCLVLMAAGPWRIGRGRTPLGLRGSALALGLPTVGGWLVVRWLAPLGLAPAGLAALALLLGARWAVGATTLGGILAGQWLAQLALVVLAAACGGPAAALLIHAAWTTALLAWTSALLARAAGTENLAQLPPFEQPLRRTALAYGVGAASALGLPLVAGYDLHRQLLAALPNWLAPLMLASQVLLALAFITPLAACVRRPAWRGAAGSERGAGPLLIAALALIGGVLWPALATALRGQASAAALTAGVAQALLALLVVAVTTRRLRRLGAAPAFNGGELLDAEPGWALPWAALGRAARPRWLSSITTLGRAGTAAGTCWAQTWQPIGRQLSRRYYLGLLLVLVLAAVLVISGAQP